MSIVIKCDNISIEKSGNWLSVELSGAELNEKHIAECIEIDTFIKAHGSENILNHIDVDNILKTIPIQEIIDYLDDDVIIAAARKIKISNIE